MKKIILSCIIIAVCVINVSIYTKPEYKKINLITLKRAIAWEYLEYSGSDPVYDYEDEFFAGNCYQSTTVCGNYCSTMVHYKIGEWEKCEWVVVGECNPESCPSATDWVSYE